MTEYGYDTRLLDEIVRQNNDQPGYDRASAAAFLDSQYDDSEGTMMRCYSDHDEDIRTKGSCDYCHGTEPQGPERPVPWRNNYAQEASVIVLRQAIKHSGLPFTILPYNESHTRLRIRYSAFNYEGEVRYPLIVDTKHSDSCVIAHPTSMTGRYFSDETGRWESDGGDFLADLLGELWGIAAHTVWSPGKGWHTYHVPIYRVQHCADFDPETARRYGRPLHEHPCCEPSPGVAR